MTVYPAAAPARRPALLVFAHGAGAGQHHPFMIRYAREFAARGIDVVTFDFPYMEAKRKVPDKGPVLDASFRQAVLEAAARPAFRAHRLFIAGKSMGGRIATHLAAAPEAWPPSAPPLAGVIVFGYPLQPPGRGASPAKPGGTDRVSHLARITVPLLVVQGTRDTFGGPDAIQRALPQAEVLALVGATHSPTSQFDQDVGARVAAFVSSM